MVRVGVCYGDVAEAGVGDGDGGVVEVAGGGYYCGVVCYGGGEEGSDGCVGESGEWDERSVAGGERN